MPVKAVYKCWVLWTPVNNSTNGERNDEVVTELSPLIYNSDDI